MAVPATTSTIETPRPDTLEIDGKLHVRFAEESDARGRVLREVVDDDD
jgi:hypothetical protein